jgi:hypothetical protein
VYGLFLTNYSHVHLDTQGTLPDGGFTTFDTILYMRSSSCGQSSQVACDDDVLFADGGISDITSALGVDLGPGQYYAYVDGYNDYGKYVLNAVVTPNDTCANAKDVGTGGTFTGDTVGLKNDYQASSTGTCGYEGQGNDAVFKATVPSGKTKMHLSTLGSALDTLVYVRASPCATGTELACNDDALDAQGNPKGQYSDLTVSVTAGSTYYIFMDTFGGYDGAWVLTVTFQ